MRRTAQNAMMGDTLYVSDGAVVIEKDYFYHQTDDTTPTTPTESSFSADVFGVANVTSATVQATAGVLKASAQTLGSNGSDFTYSQGYTTDVVNNLKTQYPNSATYTISTTLANSTVVNNTIAGSGANTFAKAPTLNLTAALSGGSWSGGVYSFNAATLTNNTFTLTLSGAAFSVTTAGNYKGSYADVFVGGTQVAEVGANIVSSGDTLPDIVLTFNLTDTPDKDAYDNIVNFTAGDNIYIGIAYQNALVGAADGLGTNTVKAFIETSLTGINLYAEAAAIPEPSTYTAIFGGISLLGAAFWRRRPRA